MVKQIRLLVLDIDGVLTDGRESIGDPSAITKHISLQDLDGVTAAKRAGLSVAFITGEDGATIDRIGERFGVVHIRRGAKKNCRRFSRWSQNWVFRSKKPVMLAMGTVMYPR